MPEREEPKFSRRDFLKGTLALGGAAIVGGLAYREFTYNSKRDYDPERSASLLNTIQVAENPAKLPNIIIINADDLGYGDLGVYGSQAIATPHLDQMAADGVRLTNFYSSAPLCSASRASLLTGRYPIRTMVTSSLYPAGSPMKLVMELAGFSTNGVTGIPEDEVTLPELLRKRGYNTALLGKWHLGDQSPHLPNENGFDLFYGALYSNDMHPYEILRDGQVEISAPLDQNSLTQNLTREAIQFISDNQDNPFFLYLAHPMPHEPIHASEAFRGRSAAGLYGDAVEEVDWSTGELLKALEDLDLDENTLVVFTSDNGPWWQGNPGAVRGRKNLSFEGGHRIPFIARWPGVLPAGTVSDEMSMNFDLFATSLHIAGIPLPGDRAIDGKNILPMLIGDAASPHDTFYFFKGKNLVGVRHNNWKYLERHMTDNGGYASLSQGPFLFNLEVDPNESYSLIESKPEVASQLEAMMANFEAEIEENIRGWH